MSSSDPKRFCELVSIKHPIIQAPMAGGPTTPELVATVSTAGALGSIGAGYLAPDKLRDSIKAVRKLTDAPFAVNIFIPPATPPSKTLTEKPRIEMQKLASEAGASSISFDVSYQSNHQQQVEVLLEERVPVLSFTFGILGEENVRRFKEIGTVLIGTATSRKEGELLEAAGCDAIVAQGFEAGGHRGSFIAGVTPQVSLMPLLMGLASSVSCPVIASGGIMDGRGILASFVLGASAVQLGTAFLATAESGASKEWKTSLGLADDTDTVQTKAFSGKSARGIMNEFVQRMEAYDGQLPEYPIQNSITKQIRVAAKSNKDTRYQSLWAGQGSRMVRTGIGAADLVSALNTEVETALEQINEGLSKEA